MGVTSRLQEATNQAKVWSDQNNMQINSDKTKVMEIYFGKKKLELKDIVIENKTLEKVDTIKVLGVMINDRLNWSEHVNFITAKATRRLYFLVLLLRAGTPKQDVLQVYFSVIRSVLEYASEVWHGGLTQELSDKIEHIQKRAVKLIFPEAAYDEACETHSIPSLCDRRKEKCKKLFNDIQRPQHKLHHLLPPVTEKRTLRETSTRKYYLPAKCTNRFLGSPINYCIKEFQ